MDENQDEVTMRKEGQKGSFARNRLHALLSSQCFGAVSTLVASVADMIVAGNLVGIDALSGIAVVLPVSIGAQFLARLVYCGAGYLFAGYQGQMNRDEARRVVGLSLETAAAVGLAIFAVTFFGRDIYLDAIGISGAVREQAVLYWRWIFVYYSIYPVAMTMLRLVAADGETVTTAISDTLASPLTIILSIFFTKMTGTAAGAALGVLVGECVPSLIMVTHVFRKSNAVIPIWNFSWRRLRELVFYSLTDSVSKLCQCGFVAVVNKLVVYTASASYLPVVGMVVFVQQLCDFLDRAGDAYSPIAAMYKGERNLRILDDLARHTLLVSLVVGLLMLVVVELLAPQIVALYGIPPGEVFDSAVVALRISATVFPFSSVLLFLGSHYLVLDRVGLSIVLTFSAGFLLTASCAAAFCFVWGLNALWIGVPTGGILTLLAIAFYSWLHQQTPLLIPKGQHAVFNTTFAPEPQQIVRARDIAESFLREQGVSAGVTARIMLLVEECSMSVVDACAKPNRIRVEVSFVLDREAVTLILRDTGKVRDLTAEDAQVTSLRSFVVAGIMRSHENRRYLNTIGCNRAVFIFARNS